MLCPECRKPMNKMCYDCGIFFEEPEFIVNNFPTQQMKPSKGYEKKTHFKEVLALFQGRENFDFNMEVVGAVKDALGPNLDTATVHTVRLVLKDLKMTKHLESAHNIRSPTTLHPADRRRQTGSLLQANYPTLRGTQAP